MTEPKGHHRPPWISGEWAGLIALILALGVSVSMVVALAGVMLSNEPISSEKSSLLSTFGGAAIGVVGTYIGAHGRGRRASDDDQAGGERRSDAR
jgi:hypothetical protein